MLGQICTDVRPETTRADVKPCAVADKPRADEAPPGPEEIISPEINNEANNGRDGKTQNDSKQPDTLELWSLAESATASTDDLHALNLRQWRKLGDRAVRKINLTHDFLLNLTES
jgi:hypothetical protein